LACIGNQARKPVPDHVLRQIVDDIFISLVTTGRQPADRGS
jgi:hypothetical protein